jgi:hypothetical protein
MCFAKSPTPKAPPPPPSERDANLDALRDRRRAVAAAKESGLESTIATSPLGLPGSGPAVGKATLGA